MKKNFFITNNLLHKCLSVFSVLVFLASCSNQQSSPKLVFDLDTPGGEIVAFFEDNTPQLIVFYNIDEHGETQEQVGVAEYYPNKQERCGGAMKNGKRDGQWYHFFPDGTLQSELFYVEGVVHGSYALYRENGKLLLKGHYDHGICDGIWYRYDENGKQISKEKSCGSCPKCFTNH